MLYKIFQNLLLIKKKIYLFNMFGQTSISLFPVLSEKEIFYIMNKNSINIVIIFFDFARPKGKKYLFFKNKILLIEEQSANNVLSIETRSKQN